MTVKDSMNHGLFKYIVLPAMAAAAGWAGQHALASEVGFRAKIKESFQVNTDQSRDIITLKDGLTATNEELRDMHKDQLKFYSFMYETWGEKSAARLAKAKLDGHD